MLTAKSNKNMQICFLVFSYVLNFVSRIVYYTKVYDHDYFYGLFGGYLSIARNIAEGLGYVVNYQGNFIPVIYRMPGYPFLISFSLKISNGYNYELCLAIIHAIINSFNPILCFLIGKKIFKNNIAGYLSAILYLTSPIFLKFDAVLVPGSLISFFVLLSVLFSIYSLESHRKKIFYMLIGFSIGLSIYIKSVTSYFPFLLVIFLLVYEIRINKTYIKKLIPIIWVFTTILLALLPWIVRNYMVYDRIILTNYGVGPLLLHTVAEVDEKYTFMYGDEKAIRRTQGLPTLYPDTIERGKKDIAIYKEHLKNNLFLHLKGTIKRIPRLLCGYLPLEYQLRPSFNEFRGSEINKTDKYKRLYSIVLKYVLTYPLQALTLLGYQVLIWMLVLSSFVLNYKHFRTYIILLFPVYLLILLPIHVEPRYYLPAFPFLLIYSAGGLHILINKFKIVYKLIEGNSQKIILTRSDPKAN